MKGVQERFEKKKIKTVGNRKENGNGKVREQVRKGHVNRKGNADEEREKRRKKWNNSKLDSICLQEEGKKEEGDTEKD